jgi:cold shock CspA family protein
LTGTIKTMQYERGFGFITGDDRLDYFFHRTGTRSNFVDLTEGDEVSFDVEPDQGKGPRANNVTVLAKSRGVSNEPKLA